MFTALKLSLDIVLVTIVVMFLAGFFYTMGAWLFNRLITATS